MRVLILGATGFIGFPAAQALVRAGHIVYGLTRTSAKVKQLAAEEIIPIVGEPESLSWLKLVPKLDVIIDAVGGSADIKALSEVLLDAIIKAAKDTRPAGSSKLTFIYTSGTWVHGDNRKEIVSDTTPITNPVNIVAWRVDYERRIIHDSTINGIVIRPSLLYGRSGSILASLFKSAYEGKVIWPGTPGGRLATIHADDLADIYVQASEKAPLVGGIIFDASNNSTESVDDILQKLVEISGAQSPYEYKEPANAFEAAVSTTGLLRPYLARSLLGWSPRKPSLVDGLEIFYSSFLAAQDGTTSTDLLKNN